MEKIIKYLFLSSLFISGVSCSDSDGQGGQIEVETLPVESEVLAFPSAEGYGKHTIGGRGGKVYEVTNLNDSGAGSLRAAVEANGPRIVVFRVSGTIKLKSKLSIRNPYITIAGQTAPGDGICLRDNFVDIGANQVIIRHIRIRLGDETNVEGDCITGRYAENIILDHVTSTWSVDECMSIYHCKNVTVQWCLVGESLFQSVHNKGYHGFGGIWGSDYSSYHHNLIVNNSCRNIRFANGSGHTDYRNNVIYNWGYNSCYGGFGTENETYNSAYFNVVANYYKPGPATEPGKVSYRIANPSIADQKGDKLGLWYIADNYIEGASEEAERVRKDNWDGGVQIDDQSFMSKIKLDEPWKVTEPVTQHSPQEAYELVLEKVGATYPQRDPVDTRIINEVRTGVATYEGVYKAVKRVADASKISGIIDTQKTVGGWPELKSEPAPLDSDHDGMPDEWELRYGLNPNDASDGSKKYDDGYTYVEKYINSLCD